MQRDEASPDSAAGSEVGSSVEVPRRRFMVKEELLKFDGTPLFPERRAYTANYKLSGIESALYEAVTSYVKEEMARSIHSKIPEKVRLASRLLHSGAKQSTCGDNERGFWPAKPNLIHDSTNR